MADEMHDVVKLILARIESHPEEFGRGAHRWDWIIERVQNYGSKEECGAIDAALRPIRLQEVHEDMMDELCNGDERRRKEREDEEYYQRTLAQQKLTAQQLVMQQQNALGVGTATPSQVLNVTTRHPTMADMQNNGIMNALRNIK